LIPGFVLIICNCHGLALWPRLPISPYKERPSSTKLRLYHSSGPGRARLLWYTSEEIDFPVSYSKIMHLFASPCLRLKSATVQSYPFYALMPIALDLNFTYCLVSTRLFTALSPDWLLFMTIAAIATNLLTLWEDTFRRIAYVRPLGLLLLRSFGIL